MEKNKEYSDRSNGNRWRLAAWTTGAILLLLPLLAMQVTDQVVWDLMDFAIFGTFLVSVGLALELAVKKTDNTSYRFAFGVALAASFLLAVVNGAVGIIGTEHNNANFLFGGVLVVGVVGAIIARFRPLGMAFAMFAAALAQILVAVIVLIAGLGSSGAIWPMDLLLSTGFFAALWLIAAWLFRKAAREQLLANRD